MRIVLVLMCIAFSAAQAYQFNHLANSKLNKGTSFTSEERKANGVTGLVPRGKVNVWDKVENVMNNIRNKNSPLEKYVYLHSIQDTEEPLYFAAMALHTTELMPIAYTPTVGEACQKWHQISRPVIRGLYLQSDDAGNVLQILDNHPSKEVDVIVFTDGERILGLGDLGVNGMGIPIGKLALYSALAGIPPERVLPVHIDVGTDNESLLKDPLYSGLKRKRDRTQAYDDLIAEFVTAAQQKYGRSVLLQFEDFGNSNAFRLLEDFQDKATTFNDDIQGTASVAVAGLMSSLRSVFPNHAEAGLGDHTYLFFGAGEAGVGIADLLCREICNTKGISMEEARKKVFLMDSKGLVTNNRGDLEKMAHHKLPYAHNVPHRKTLLECVETIKPSVLIGAAAQPQVFTQPVLKAMRSITQNTKLEREQACADQGTTMPPTATMPVIMALSNPTSKAECTAEQAYEHTQGECVFISGSPFDAVTLPDGRVMKPGQGNNAYIFPGVGLGAVLSQALSITDDDFLVAARALADCVDSAMLKEGSAYPPLTQITTVSRRIALKTARHIIETGRSALPKGTTDAELEKACEEYQFDPFKFYL